MVRSFAPRTLLLALLALGLLAAPAAAGPTIDGEFKLATPIETNTKIAAGPDGNVWVNLTGPAKDVARITPAGGITEYELGVAGTSGVAAGSDGNVWVTSANAVTVFAPDDPETKKLTTPIAGIEGNSPIVGGPDGNLWVATKDKVLRIPPVAPATFTPFTFTGLSPTDIDATNAELVIADAGTVKRILAVKTDGTSPGSFPVGGPPQGVAGNPNGIAAFTQPVNAPKEMGILAPGAPLVVQISGGLDPFGLALGADGAYWSAERNSNGLLRMTPSGEITPLTGFSAGSEPRQIAAGPNRTLWVTLPGAGVNSVGRVSGVETAVVTPPPPLTAPETRITAGPKGKLTTTKNFKPVRFGFNSPDPATAFECKLRKLAPKGKAKGTGAKGSAKAKAPKFKPCSSPKGYKVKPGRYRFEVRAVNQGIPDATPAKRGFSVVRVFAID